MKHTIRITILLLALTGLLLVTTQCGGGANPIPTRAPAATTAPDATQPAESPAATSAPGATQPPAQPTKSGSGAYPAATVKPAPPSATAEAGAYPSTTP